jgi:HrpA-like RNA helicase
MRNEKIRVLRIGDSAHFPVETLPELSAATDCEHYCTLQVCQAIQRMMDPENACEFGDIVVFVSGLAFCQRLAAALRLLQVPNSTVLQFEFHSLADIDSFPSKVLHETNGDDDGSLLILPIVDSDVFEGKPIVLPSGLGAKLVRVIVTTEETDPIIETNNVVCVIDTGLCQLPSYDRRKDSVTWGHWIASPSTRVQRKQLVGRACPGLYTRLDSRYYTHIQQALP